MSFSTVHPISVGPYRVYFEHDWTKDPEIVLIKRDGHVIPIDWLDPSEMNLIKGRVRDYIDTPEFTAHKRAIEDGVNRGMCKSLETVECL